MKKKRGLGMESYHTVCKKPEELYQSFYHSVREIRNLKELISGSCELYGDLTAFLTKEEKGGEYHEISYREFYEDLNALGTKLTDLGLRGKKIAVIGENCYDWVVAYFAIVNGTGTVVPLDRELGKDEIFRLIDAAECSAVFYTGTYRELFAEKDLPFQFEMAVYGKQHDAERENDIRRLICEGKELLLRGDRRFLDAEVEDDAMCSLIFTSGTTGTPKGVMLSHRNIASNIMNTAKIFKIETSDRSLSMLPIHHTFESTIGIMGLLFQGGSVAFFEGLKYLNKNLMEAKCTMLVGVPLIFENIYAKIWKTARKEKKEKALKAAIALNRRLNRIGIDMHKTLFRSVYKPLGGRIRIILSGAAGLNPKIVRGLYELGFKFAQGYGLTETAPLAAGTPDFVKDRYKKAGSCGPALPQGELRIKDPNEDGIGEIQYRGPNVMLGYYNMPEETAEVLQDGWFSTGDLGFLDSLGWVYITGRKKNVIVTKTGKNIYPEEIEGYLDKIPEIEECMVYGTDSEDENDTIVSVQVRPDMEAVHEVLGEDPTEEEIYALIRDRIGDMNLNLPNYKRVRHVVLRRKEFVKTTTQKIKRMDNIHLLEADMYTED